MKVLMIRPRRHPVELEIEDTLEAMYEALECDTITASDPWEEPMALVTDDNGFFSNKQPCRYVKELEQPIMGNFFLCGISGEDFADLPADLMKRFKERFWKPELIGVVGGRLAVFPIDDGTKSM